MEEELYKHMDDLFREAADTPGPPPTPAAWQKMEALLEEDRRRRRVVAWWWLPLVLIGVAAGSFYYFEPPATTRAFQQTAGGRGLVKTKENPFTVSPVNSGKAAPELITHTPSTTMDQASPSAKTDTVIPVQLFKTFREDKPMESEKDLAFGDLFTLKHSLPDFVAAINSSSGEIFPRRIKLPSQMPDADSSVKSSADNKKIPEKKFLPVFIYAVAAPEASFVPGNPMGKLRPAYGLGLGFNLSRRFFIQAGIHSSTKTYGAKGSDYYPKDGSYYNNEHIKLTWVDADCELLEIPVMAGYNLIQKKKRSVYISAGFSSAIMKREYYDYQYTRYGQPAQSSHTYKTGSFTPVANVGLAAGYRQKIGNRFSILAAPYLFLPVKGVGEGKVELASVGLQAGLLFEPFNVKQK